MATSGLLMPTSCPLMPTSGALLLSVFKSQILLAQCCSLLVISPRTPGFPVPPQHHREVLSSWRHCLPVTREHPYTPEGTCFTLPSDGATWPLSVESDPLIACFVNRVISCGWSVMWGRFDPVLPAFIGSALVSELALFWSVTSGEFWNKVPQFKQCLNVKVQQERKRQDPEYKTLLYFLKKIIPSDHKTTSEPRWES